MEITPIAQWTRFDSGLPRVRSWSFAAIRAYLAAMTGIVPLADIPAWEHTRRMSSLYPARRIPQGMILIGSAFMALALAMAVGHFGFGVPVYNRNTGQPSSDFAVAILAFAFGGIGGSLALAGRAVLRASSRHHRKRAIDANGS